MGPTDVPRPRERENWPQSAKIFALIIGIHSIALFTTKQPVAVFGNVRGFPSNQRIPSWKTSKLDTCPGFSSRVFVTNWYATTHVRKSADGFYIWGIPNTLRMSRVDTSARLMVHTKYELNLAPKFSSVLNLIVFKKCIDFSVLFSQMSTRGKHRRNQTIN